MHEVLPLCLLVSNCTLHFFEETGQAKLSGSNILSDTPQGVVNWEKRDNPLFIIISFEMVSRGG